MRVKSCRAFSVNIGRSVLRVLIVYLISCCLAYCTLLVISEFVDIENLAECMYQYVHSHYDWYAERDRYDFNPALGDLLIGGFLLLSVFITFLLSVVMRIWRGK